MTSPPPESPYGPAAPGPAHPHAPASLPAPAPAAPASAPAGPAPVWTGAVAYGSGGYAPVVVERRWGDAARDAWSVNVRCQAVLAGVAVLGAIAFGLAAEAAETAQIMAFVWVVHAVVTLVIGYPIGVVVGRLLPPAPTRGAASAAFLLAGGVAGALAMSWAGPFAALGWGALGAVTAGGARAWAHGVIEGRRLRWSAVQSPAVAWAPGPSAAA